MELFAAACACPLSVVDVVTGNVVAMMVVALRDVVDGFVGEVSGVAIVVVGRTVVASVDGVVVVEEIVVDVVVELVLGTSVAVQPVAPVTPYVFWPAGHVLHLAS
jgi:hypothetical protein